MDPRGQKRRRESPPQRFRPNPQLPSNDYRGHSSASTSWSKSDQARINQIQEAERHREYLAKEGQFVLQQKRKAAEIRVKEGRARPIDWLTVNLKIINPVTDLLNDDTKVEEVEYFDPESVINDLSSAQLFKMQQEIDEFLDLEESTSSRDYWRNVQVMCKDREQGARGKAVRAVSTDIDDLLGPKSYEQLERLEKQIKGKLNSGEPIDTDYWQQLSDSLLVYKAKAKLKKLYKSVLDDKMTDLRTQNAKVARDSTTQLSVMQAPARSYSDISDPEPVLVISPEDQSCTVVDESKFLHDVATDRAKVMNAGYIPPPKRFKNETLHGSTMGKDNAVDGIIKNAFSSFDRDVAKGVEEDEEVFAGEEHVETKNADVWKGKYRPRKPRYFNRVQMGFEWNKYNQTHYDHDNPPPKVVQGYKFHVFYPDLIDLSRAPTYRIIREGGRKKGETIAAAGEEDTCIIRFMSGPPYEDIAFRIVDRDWDYSAKHDRGFKSTFEKGILTLHFSFKKIYYRK